MFDVGFWELTLIGVVALIIIGPERLPGAAHTVGLWVGKGRRMLRDVKADIDRELREQNVADLTALKKDIQSAGDQFKQATEKIGESAAAKTEVEQAAASLKESFVEASPLGKDDRPKTADKTNDAQPGPAEKTTGKKSAESKKTGGRNPANPAKSDEKTAGERYYIYENLAHKYATIHAGTCSYCNEGRGTHGVRDGDRERDAWHGPFDGLETAERRQNQLSARKKTKCGHCFRRRPLS